MGGSLDGADHLMPKGVDVVALVLAVALAVEALTFGVAVIVALIEHEQPPILGAPTELILSGLTSGIVGLLGGYIGGRHRGEGDPH